MKRHVDAVIEQGFLDFFDKRSEHFAIAAIAARADRHNLDVYVVELGLDEVSNGMSLNQCKFAAASS